MTLAARLHRRDPRARRDLEERLRPELTPAVIEGLATAFRDWFSHGLTLTTFSTVDDAVALAETEPPSWSTPFPTGGGQWVLEIGDCLVMYKGQWAVQPDERTPPELIPFWSEYQRKAIVAFGHCTLDGEQLDRLANNVLVALTERPEGITVVERRASPKAERKRGRRYYPGVEYTIGSTTPLRKGEGGEGEGGEGGGGNEVDQDPPQVPHEGWTLSVRTIVRGHWRRQPFGSGLSARRVQWIRPHWKGPKDAPISAHATRFNRPPSDDDGS